MKTILLLLVTMLTINLSAQDGGQSTTVNDTITVSGNCGHCKERIENAALIKGVKFAEWNKESHELVLIYKSDKVTLEEIEKSILKAGHDVGEKKGDDEAYKALPGCCQYKTGGTCTH